MDLFPAIAIIIVVLVIIIIVVVVVVIVTNQSKGSTTNNDCSNQNDCPSGYVCIHTATGSTGTCKAGVGTSCNTDADCSTDLICSSTNNSTNKVCSRKNSSSQNITRSLNSDPLIPSNTNSIRRRITWASLTNSKPNVTSSIPQNIPSSRIRIPSSKSNYTANTCTPLSPDIPIIHISESSIPQILPTIPNSENIPIEVSEITQTISRSRNGPVGSERSCTPLSSEELVTDNNEEETIIPVIAPVNTQSIDTQQINIQQINNIPVESRQPTRRIVIRKGDNGDSITPLSDVIGEKKSTTVKTYTTRTDTVKTNTGRVSTALNNISCQQPTGNSINQDAMIRSVVPISRRFVEREVTTLDDEENSDGDYTDGRFDVRSGESTKSSLDSPRDVLENTYNYPITSVSTPCEEKDGVYYCRSNKADIIQEHDRKIDHSPVIDVCSYSNATVFLLEDGNIICEIDKDTKNRYRASNNIPLIRITSFDGYLHAVGTDHKLYSLPNNYFPTTNWMWNVADWAPTDIKHISSTHDSSHLWIQTSSTGLLYSAPGVISSKTPYSNMKRVYGRDVNHYIDIDPLKFTAKIYPGNTLVHNVYDGALSYYDEVIAIHPSERNEYRGITIVNWRPYYIRV